MKSGNFLALPRRRIKAKNNKPFYYTTCLLVLANAKTLQLSMKRIRPVNVLYRAFLRVEFAIVTTEKRVGINRFHDMVSVLVDD